MAKSRPPVALYRLLLQPQHRTFRGPRWTSGFDPEETFNRVEQPLSATQKSGDRECVSPPGQYRPRYPAFGSTVCMPKEVEHWSLTTLREKLVKIGAKVVSHGRYVTFQLAEVAVPRELFREILRLIDGLRSAPLPP